MVDNESYTQRLLDKESILQVDEPKPEEKPEGENNEGNSSSGDSKKITLEAPVNDNSGNSETKKINI